MSKIPLYADTALLCAALAFATSLEGASLTIAGSADVQPQFSTNSVFSDFSLEDGIIFSHSAVDSHITIETPRQIHDFAPGVLACSITTASGASNTVSVLFGDPSNPALTAECDGVWHILPPHRFAAYDDVPPALAVSTNRLDFSFRLGATGLVSDFTARSSSGIVDVHPALTSAQGFRWADSSCLPQHWASVTVLIAGPEAALLDLTLRYTRDRAVMEVR